MSSHLFDRDQWRCWSPIVMEGVTRRFDSPVLGRFTVDATPSWIEWINAAQGVHEGAPVDSVAITRDLLLTTFSAVRIYHATRLEAIDPIRAGGLRAWSADELAENARTELANFAKGSLLEVAIRSCEPSIRAGCVYAFSSLDAALGITEEHGLGTIPVFAVDGGEFISAVSRRLNIQYSEIRRNQTRGYLFACDIPWGALGAETVKSIAQHALTTSLAASYSDPERYRMAGGMEAISVKSDILPSSIEAYAETDHLVGQSIRKGDLSWTTL